jgi:hypothetical protein
MRRTRDDMPVLYVAAMKHWFTDDTAMLPITVGTVLWLVAGIVVLIALGPTLWLWVCAVGFVSGVAGMIYLRRRARRPGIRYE